MSASDGVEVVELAEGEAEAMIEAILEAFPSLRDWTPPCPCGSYWCGDDSLNADERDALRQLQGLRFLLGES